MNKKKNVVFSILFFWFYILLICPSAYAKDKVNLDLIGRWRNAGSIKCTEILRHNGHSYAYCGTSGGLLILDVTDPQNVKENAFLEIGRVNDIAFYNSDYDSNKYTVLLTVQGIWILCLNDPTAPTFAGRYDIEGDVGDVVLSSNCLALSSDGKYAFVADWKNGLVIMDIQDPTAPTFAGGCGTGGFACGVALSSDGKYAFVADRGNGLVIIDIQDPTAPTLTGGYDNGGGGRCVALSSDSRYAFVPVGDVFVIIDIQDPSDPTLAGQCYIEGHGWDSALDVVISSEGKYAFVADWYNGLVIIDIRDPTDPTVAGSYDTEGSASGVTLFSDERYAFVADSYNGLVIIDIQDPTVPTFVDDYDTAGNPFGVTLSSDGRYAFVPDSYNNGLVIIDIRDPSDPTFVGLYDTMYAHSIALSSDGRYAFVPDGNNGLVIIDIRDPKDPTFAGGCDTEGYARGVALSSDDRYTFVADGRNGLVIIDIQDPIDPTFVGRYDTVDAHGITLSSDNRYAFVADGYNGLVIIDIQDHTDPTPVGGYKTSSARGVALSSDDRYAFVADWSNGLVIIDIQDPTDPIFAGRYDTRYAMGVALSSDGRFAFLAAMNNDIIIIDIQDPTTPTFAGSYDIEGSAYAYRVALSSDDKYAFVAYGQYGLVILNIIDTSQSQGNLILSPSGPASSKNPLWAPSQAIANLAYSTFLDHQYPHYFTYYLSPDPFQDIDGDGIFDPFTVDDFDPTVTDFAYTLTNWAYNRLNIGPLYVYLTGLGKEDTYQIMPGELLKASDPIDPNTPLKHYLDTFQQGTNRDIICLFEFASSGTFCDDLIDPNTLPYSRTIITCTDEGTSYLDITGLQSFTGHLFTLLQDTNQSDPGLFEDTGISFHQRVKLLQGLFSQARKTFWAQGYPFNTQPPQMVSARGPHTLISITLKPHPILSTIPDPNHLKITSNDQHIIFTAYGHYLDDLNNPTLLPQDQIHYHSSDPSILNVTPEGEVFPNPDTSYNGIAYILGTIIDPNFTQSPDRSPNLPPIGGITGRIPIQVAINERKEKEDLPKAIIVAGRCNDRTGYDYLWESTNKMANHAYHTFIDRGYSPDNICYLSHDPNQRGVDASIKDGDGYKILETIFTDSNNPYLDLTGLTDLTIFLIDHGKHDSFILGPTDKESLSPLDLDYWLDNIQKDYPDAMITIIIEACQSGCFVEPLTQDTQNRIVITSTQDTTAYLAANGWVSFTYFLFNYLKGGATLGAAFEQAQQDIAALSWGGIQHPVLEDNRNRKLALEKLLGGSFILSQDQPSFIQVSEFDPNISILPHTPIHLWAKVTDLDGIETVWAIISASQSSLQFSGSMNDPIVGLPMVDLSYDPNTDLYQGTYKGFSYGGPYTILFLAQDTKGMVSYPRTVHLDVEDHRQDKAFLVSDPNFMDYATFAQRVLEKRRFPEDDIEHVTLSSLNEDLDLLLNPPVPLDHLLIYFISSTPLTESYAYEIDTKLDQIQKDTNCTIILLMDTPYSGSLLEPLTPPEGQKRILIAGSDPNHQNMIEHLRQPFSQFFFSSIYNGVNINQAFHSARFAIGYYSEQNPLLDDNGNGIGLEYGKDYDGKFSRSVYLGSPFEPVIAGPRISVPEAVHINGWETATATIWAEVQDPNSFVWALIISPEGPFDIEVLEHYDPNEKRFEADYELFTQPGIYRVVVYVQDSEGLLDYDESPYIVLEPDPYEQDNIYGQASPILVNHTPQVHSFHSPNDTDWVYFYAYAGPPYEVKAERDWTDCQIRIEVFAPDGESMGHSPYAVGFPAPQDGYYRVKVSYTCEVLPASYPSYELSVVCPSEGPAYQGVYGWIKDKNGEGIIGAKVCVKYKCEDKWTTSMPAWWTNDQGFKIGRVYKGFYFLDNLVEGETTLFVQKSGYLSKELHITVPDSNFVRTICYLERDPNIPVYKPPIDPNKLITDIGQLELYQDPNMPPMASLDVMLYKGLNLFSYPLDYPPSYYAGNFLETHDPDCNPNGPKWFSGMRCYNDIEGREDTCYFVLSDQNTCSIESSDPLNPYGFSINSGEGYTLYMHQAKTISFSFTPPNSQIALKEGINWVGIPSPPPEYTSRIMLREIGSPEEVVSISGYSPITGQWESTFWKFGKPGGENFPIVSGQGYMVFMEKEKDWLPGFGFQNEI